MEQLARQIGRLTALAMFFWLVGAFFTWTLNPGQWSEEWRVVLGGVYAIMAMLVCLWGE